MSRDRRNSFRAPLSKEDQDAVLEFDGQKVPVRVHDESAGGFSVSTHQTTKLKADDIVRLRFTDRLTELRVARVQKLGVGVNLGLERIRDLEYVDFGTARQLWFDPRAAWRTRNGKLAVVASGVLLTAGITFFFFQLGTQGSGVHHGLAAVLPLNDANISVTNKTRLPPLHVTKEFRHAINEHPGLDVFALPEMVQQLALTAEQREKIDRLIEDAKNEASDSVDASLAAGETSDADRAAKSQWKALALLTNDQQLRLKAILEQATSAATRVRELARRNWPKANVRQLVDRLGGAALVLPQVARELRLTSQQEAQIADIIETAFDTSDALAHQAKAQANGQTLASEAVAVLEKARADALDVLTPEQSERLKSLTR
jgi:Spy/CpxP family protein refolding chaperone